MRYKEFKLSEQQLDELKMSPSSLGAFAKSPLAQGIQAGFEAELLFPGMGGPDEDGDMEPDYDMDERCSSIDDIIAFFSYDDYGYGISGREESRLRSSLDEAYWEYADEQMYASFKDDAHELIKEYIEENDFDREEEMREYLSAEGVKDIDAIMDAGRSATSTKTSPPEYLEAQAAVDEKLDELAEESYNSQDGTYDAVLEQYRDDYSWPEEREFLSNQDIRYMSDVADQYDLSWPYMRIEGGDDSGFNEDNAEQLADDLNRTLGYTTKVSSGYHGAKRDSTTWIFEPDSSLNADEGDMPVEIVSPPMELDECLKALDDFFSWAKGHNAYTNSSTGFHMGVSLPNVGGKVDFVKLALFLGDEYVLQAFGREAVGFCESAIKKIKNRMKGQDTRIADAMALMRKGLIDIAHNSIASDEGFGKYTSINPKGNYIEFRSAGGEDYFADIPKLRNMLLRYAQAMVVAADPKAERNEYHKKLYKLISPAGGNTSLDLFARYATGAISAADLKQQWATATLAKDSPAALNKSNWAVVIKSSGATMTGYEFNNMTRSEAYAEVKQKMSPGSSQQDFDAAFEHNYELRDLGATAEKPNRRVELAKRIKGPTPPNYYIRNIETGEFVYLYTAKDNQDAVVFLDKYRSTHPGMFQYGLTKVLAPNELAQAKKNTEADAASQQPAQQQSEPRHQQQVRSPNGVPMWEIYNRVTGLGLHQFADHTQNLAWQTAQTWAQEQGFADRMDVLSVRPVMPQV